MTARGNPARDGSASDDVPIAPPAAEAAPTPEAEPAPKRGRSYRHSTVRVIGLFGCLILAIGILFGRGWVSDQVGGVFDSIDDGDRPRHTVVAMTTGRLEERVADLDTLVADLSARWPNRDGPDRHRRTSHVTSPTGSARSVTAGSQSGRASTRRSRPSRSSTARLPFVDLPSGPTEELAALDQRIAEIDASVRACGGCDGADRQAVVDGGDRSAWRGRPRGRRRDTDRDRVGGRRGPAGPRPGKRRARSCGRRRSSCCCWSATSPSSTAPPRAYRRT